MTRVSHAFVTLLLMPATLLDTFPVSADAGVESGYYGFSVSASDVDPFVNNPPNPGEGILFLYLWSLDACNPIDEEPGWLAAEFKIATPITTGWEILAFSPAVGISDIGPGADETGKNFLMASPDQIACGLGMFVVGELVVRTDDGPGVLEFTESDCDFCSNWAIAADCRTLPEVWHWPQYIRFIGWATEDAGPNQDAGSGCGGPVPVESASWGQVKVLYR